MGLDLRRKFLVDGKLRRGWRAEAWLRHVTRCDCCGVAGDGQHRTGCVVLAERERCRHIAETLLAKEWAGNAVLRLIDSGGWP